jgi:ubiquinone/menaquinone biosynthesis C-methylase UbiE
MADSIRHITSSAAGSEEQRVRLAYARRGSDSRYDWANPAYAYAMHDLERQVLATLSRGKIWPLASRRILDVGCGTGHWLRRLLSWGAQPRHVAGIDLLRPRLRDAADLSPAGTRLSCGSALQLPFPEETFDLVLQFTVFTSILDSAVRRQVAGEMMRVVRPGGAILWYDFCVGNPRNPDVRAVTVSEVRELFPGWSVNLRRVTLAPPLTRLLAPVVPELCGLLNLVPLLRTHRLGVIRKV